MNLALPKSKGKNLNLEALRGVLALMVVLSHVELIRFYFGHSQNYLHPIILHLGRVAVTGFFVLSGYLITYSILKRIKANDWNIRQFYSRRILRIWPMYYLVIVLAIVVLPHIESLKFVVPTYSQDARLYPFNYWYYIFFLPQIPQMNEFLLPFAEPTWSIGIEELFYVFIPWVIILLRKYLVHAIIAFILLFLIAKYLMIYKYQLLPSDAPLELLTFFRFDCIALGCLVGALHFNNQKWFNAIKIWHALAAVILIIILFKNLTLYSTDYFPFAICFATIIIWLTNKSTTFKSPEWLVFIGKISYSLYLTHEIVIVFLVNLNLDKKGMVWMYSASIIGAVALATGLYYLIEKPCMDFANSKSFKK